MKKLTILSIIFTLLLFQGCKSQKRLTQTTKDKTQERLLTENAISSLEKNEFVLEANRVLFQYGKYANVNSYTNFIKVKDNRATIQLAFDSPEVGANGLGGITLEGSVYDIKYKKSKKGIIDYSMAVRGPVLSATIHITMGEGSNYCTALITTTHSGKKATFTGYLYSIEDSNIYVGRAI